MANYFIASVGTADAFRQVNGKLVHFFSSQTLTDSAINISVSNEEVRGGAGAQLLGQYFHTSSLAVTLTDILFKLEYIQAQVGGEIHKGGLSLTQEEVPLINNRLTLKGKPVEVLAKTGPIAWYTKAGASDYRSVSKFGKDGSGNVTIKVVDGSTSNTNKDLCISNDCNMYCVEYYSCKADADKLIVSANFIPSEIVLIITAQLFAGDASAPTTGRPIGTVTITIPRFQLNGEINLALNMSGASSTELSGNALAYSEGCQNTKYADIVVNLAISPWSGFTKLVALDGTNEVGQIPVIYAVACNKTPKEVDNALLIFPPGALDANGAWAHPGGSWFIQLPPYLGNVIYVIGKETEFFNVKDPMTLGEYLRFMVPQGGIYQDFKTIVS